MYWHLTINTRMEFVITQLYYTITAYNKTSGFTPTL